MSLKFRVLILFLMMSSTMVDAQDNAALDLLQGYEWQLSESKLSQLGPEAYRALLGIAEDETQVNFIRARAITALSKFPNEEVWEYFSMGLDADQGAGHQAKIKRRQLVEGLCDSFLESRPVQVGDVLIPLLETSDVRVKIKIANCLQSVDSAQVGRALVEYRSKISEPWEFRAAGFEAELE